MTPAQRERYSRQIFFEGIGDEGQQRLLAATVAIAGCGALGSFQAGALARAGVGRLLLVDRDYVELSNLQRQWLYEEEDAERALPKAVAAAGRLSRINQEVRAEAHVTDLAPENIADLLEEADLILDGTDNFETRYLINDFAVQRGKPWIYGAAVGSYGLILPVIPGQACFRCVYPDPPAGAQPTCETAGVINSITSLVASWQVSQAFRILCGLEVGAQLTRADAWSGGIRQMEVRRDPDCPCCGRRQFPSLEGKHRAPISLCGRNAVQIHERKRPLDLPGLERQLTHLGRVRGNEFAVRFFPSGNDFELTFFPDGRAIIKGTTDPALARSLYARYVGT
jgi:adenylyltransferase/sulfurtransferase